jgi:hypothetical protein
MKPQIDLPTTVTAANTPHTIAAPVSVVAANEL